MNRSKEFALFLSFMMLLSVGIVPVLAQTEVFSLPNPSFTPGHPLYGLEIFSEEYFEVPIAGLFGGLKARAEKRLRLAEERLAEMEAIANGSNANALERLRHRYEFQMNKTDSMMFRINSTEFESLLTSRTMHHIEVLTELRERLPVQAMKGIDKALEVSVRYFGVHMNRTVSRIHQIEEKGVNVTDLKIKMEAVRNRVAEKIMAVQEMVKNKPSVGYDFELNVPEMPEWYKGIGNRTQRGHP